VTVDNYAIGPYVLESNPVQSIVTGTCTGPSDSVQAALAR
jgi:hypothetical protein